MVNKLADTWWNPRAKTWAYFVFVFLSLFSLVSWITSLLIFWRLKLPEGHLSLPQLPWLLAMGTKAAPRWSKKPGDNVCGIFSSGISTKFGNWSRWPNTDFSFHGSSNCPQKTTLGSIEDFKHSRCFDCRLVVMRRIDGGESAGRLLFTGAK